MGTINRIEVYNLISILNGRGGVNRYEGSVESVLNQIRDSCSDKGRNPEEWATLIRQHGQVPTDHPFVAFCNSLSLADDHPLRTIGSWAFGFQNQYITISFVDFSDNQGVSGRKQRHEIDPWAPLASGGQ